MRVPLLDLPAQYRALAPEIDAAVRRVMQSGQFILGEEVAALERELATAERESEAYRKKHVVVSGMGGER